MKDIILLWTPRIFSILAIPFMMMFSLDCFGENHTLKLQFLCLLMHNIPAFILMLVLITAWKWEMAGGILFLLAALAGSIYFRAFNGNSFVMFILSPFIIAGILFILFHEVFANKQNS